MATIQVVLEFVDDELMNEEQFEPFVSALVGTLRLHPCFSGYKVRRKP